MCCFEKWALRKRTFLDYLDMGVVELLYALKNFCFLFLGFAFSYGVIVSPMS